MNLQNAIPFNGRTVNFSFHNGTLSFMRDMGYKIDLQSNPLEKLECTIDVFLADFLLCAAKLSMTRVDSRLVYRW